MLRVVLLVCIVGFLLPLQGCTSLDGSDREPTIRLSSSGRIYVEKKYTGLKRLVAQLKADGIKPSQRIVISVPRNTSPKAMQAISRKLLSNGYRRFIFQKPRKATAKKGADPLLKHMQPRKGQ